MSNYAGFVFERNVGGEWVVEHVVSLFDSFEFVSEEFTTVIPSGEVNYFVPITGF